MGFESLKLEKDQLLQGFFDAKESGDVQQDREKWSAEILNLGRYSTHKCFDTKEYYRKSCISFLKNERL